MEKNSTPPSRRVILIWYKNFKETGHMRSDAKRGRKPVYDATVNAVNELFSYNPNTSVRQAAQSVPVSKSSVHRIVKNYLKLYPYKIQLVQAIKPGDYEKREQFARTLLINVEQDSANLNRIFSLISFFLHFRGCQST